MWPFKRKQTEDAKRLTLLEMRQNEAAAHALSDDALMRQLAHAVGRSDYPHVEFEMWRDGPNWKVHAKTREGEFFCKHFATIYLRVTKVER
jgi:hypothetical protein